MPREFNVFKYWIINTLNADGIFVTIKILFRNLGSECKLPEDKVSKRFGGSIFHYLRAKIKKRVAGGCYDTLYLRDAGAWQCNWIQAKLFKWKLRQLLRHIFIHYGWIINEYEIISISWHLEYQWYSNGIIDPNNEHIICSEDHTPLPVTRTIVF